MVALSNGRAFRPPFDTKTAKQTAGPTRDRPFAFNRLAPAQFSHLTIQPFSHF